MDDIAFRLMHYGGRGFCCSQILLLLALETRGEENPGLVRAMAGLCNGLGDCSGPCGVLSGGACLLAYYAGKGSEDQQADERLPLVISEFTDWFQETVGGAYGGVRCQDILEAGNCGAPDPARCGSIVGDAFTQCMEILVQNGFDPTEPGADA